MPFRTLFALCFACLCAPCFSKGINVRFLPNPPEDSVVEYAVMRAEGMGAAPRRVGSVASLPRDTLSFADTGAIKGKAYVYSIVALNGKGGASDPSESTEVALPFLVLPDTLRGGAEGDRCILAQGADPLSGTVPFSLSLEDSSRFFLRYDPSSRQITFGARKAADSGWVVVRATYYGKFVDRDSVWIAFDPLSLSTVPDGAGRSRAWGLPASWSPRQGALRLRLPGRVAGSWRIVGANGKAVATVPLPGNGSEAAWDGRDLHGIPIEPKAYLWAVFGANGSLLGAGTLRVAP